MNYLAHGYRFLEEPLFVAGTAVPDWLRVAAPRVRVRARLVEAAIDCNMDESYRRLCSGILQHHADDDVFHASIVFQKLCEELARRFRQLMPDPCDHRPALLGHIVTELLLDSELVARDPSLLPRYYQTLDSVDSDWVQKSVNLIVGKPADRLAEFIDKFREIEFLYDYADNERLMVRLNQVIKRVQLELLNTDVFAVFDYGRLLLERHADELMQSQCSCRTTRWKCNSTS